MARRRRSLVASFFAWLFSEDEPRGSHRRREDHGLLPGLDKPDGRGRREVDPLFRVLRADVGRARRTRAPREHRDLGWPGEELFA